MMAKVINPIETFFSIQVTKIICFFCNSVANCIKSQLLGFCFDFLWTFRLLHHIRKPVTGNEAMIRLTRKARMFPGNPAMLPE